MPAGFSTIDSPITLPQDFTEKTYHGLREAYIKNENKQIEENEVRYVTKPCAVFSTKPPCCLTCGIIHTAFTVIFIFIEKEKEKENLSAYGSS